VNCVQKLETCSHCKKYALTRWQLINHVAFSAVACV